ncbi:DNA polymerase III subunit delta [Myxococcota bacterium]|nr:DNA polymerase III subunit delta [Myxococcota bacterium]
MTDFHKMLQGGAAPVYLLHGEETFLTRQASAWLRAKALEGAVEDFNLDRFDAQGALNPAEIVEAARTMPMMAARRVVWVKNAEGLFGRKADDLKSLIDYISAPDPSTCLILQAMEKARKNVALFKRAQKHGCVAEFNALSQRQVLPWVQSQVKQYKRRIDQDAAALMAEAIGADLAGLDDALSRLNLFASPGAVLSVEDVRAVVAHTRTHTIWELTDALAQRDQGEVLTRARQILEQGEHPLRVLGAITRQMRQLLIGRSLRAQGLDSAEVCKVAGVPSFLSRAFMQQLDLYSGEELLAALDALSDTDRALKGSKLPGDLLLEGLLLNLSQPRGR